jgi:hypothetical protein
MCNDTEIADVIHMGRFYPAKLAKILRIPAT